MSDNLDILDELLAAEPAPESVKRKRKGKSGGLTIYLSPKDLERAEAARAALCVKLKTSISRQSFMGIAVMAGVELMEGKL